jgi:hypothetical protein
LAASKKRALQSNSELQEVASYQRIDICNYRLVASVSNGFFVQAFPARCSDISFYSVRFMMLLKMAQRAERKSANRLELRVR